MNNKKQFIFITLSLSVFIVIIAAIKLAHKKCFKMRIEKVLEQLAGMETFEDVF